MHLNKYQTRAKEVANAPSVVGDCLALALCGKAGELANALKKTLRLGFKLEEIGQGEHRQAGRAPGREADGMTDRRQDERRAGVNPKDAVGADKPTITNVSMPVLFEVGLGLGEGAAKYGRHNFRVVPVRASIYYDATFRHLAAWWEGEDIDPDSGVHHVSKAIASLMVLRDAMINDSWHDDRPPKAKVNWLKDLYPKMKALIERYPDPKPPNMEKGQ